MKTVYLLKAVGYLALGLYIDKKESIIGGLFLGILMLFFWLDLQIKEYIDELKNK